jgi:cyclophilin family peptidyl-prolyl cis-trans isomerase
LPVYHTREEEENVMSNKKRQVRSSRRAANTRGSTNQILQLLALALILVVGGAVIWALVSSQQPQQTAGTNAGERPVQISPKQYDSAPPMMIDTNKQYTATVKMENGGEFTIQLYPDKAPITVNSFVFLAREGFFDGVTFHRVLEGFMAQGGDPTGTGGGGPGYRFVNEDSDLTFDKPGVVAMANAGRDTNGSQFFITFVPTPQLNGGYTIFGQVTSGMDVVNDITRRDPNRKPNFLGDAIETIVITEN